MAEKQDIMKLTKQILSAPEPGVYVLYGGEEFLKRHFLSDLKKAVIEPDFEDLNYTSVSGPDEADNVIETAYTLPQMADARMIVWYNSTLPSPQQKNKKPVEDALTTASGFPYLYLVVYLSETDVTSSRDDQKALEKLPGKKLFFDFLPPDRLLKWILRHFEAENVKISERDASFLCDRCGGSMTVLANQIEKLSVYVKEKGRDAVERQDIEKSVPDDPRFSAFYVSDCLRKRNVTGLLSYIDASRKRADKPQLLLASIVTETEKLCRIKFAQKSGVPSAQIAKTLGLNEYVVKLAAPAAASLTEAECTRFLQACYDADAQIKNTQCDAYDVLRQLVCSL